MSGFIPSGDERFDAMVVDTLIAWLERSPSSITYGDLAKRMVKRFSIPEPDPWRTFDAPLGRTRFPATNSGFLACP